MSVEGITALAAVLLAPVLATLTWFLSRRKEKAQSDSAIADGAASVVTTALDVMRALKTQVGELQEANTALRAECDAMKKTVKELKKEIRDVD